IAAEQAPGERGEEEQRQRRDDQQQGEEQEVLGPEGEAEDVELARRQVEQHRLAIIPAQPGEGIEHAEQPEHGGHAQGVQPAGDFARIDLALADIHRAAVVVGELQGNTAVHRSGGSALLYRLAGRSRIQVKKLEAAVATQNMKKAIEYPRLRLISTSGKVMSRSISGSTKAENTIVATPAAKKLGHRMAPTRCAIGRGGWSKSGLVKSVIAGLGHLASPGARATRHRPRPGANGYRPALYPRPASRRGGRCRWFPAAIRGRRRTASSRRSGRARRPSGDRKSTR